MLWASYYSRVLNITGVPNKGVGMNFFLKINRGDLMHKKSSIGRKEKYPKKNKNSYCLVWNSRVLTYVPNFCLFVNVSKNKQASRIQEDIKSNNLMPQGLSVSFKYSLISGILP